MLMPPKGRSEVGITLENAEVIESSNTGQCSEEDGHTQDNLLANTSATLSGMHVTSAITNMQAAHLCLFDAHQMSGRTGRPPKAPHASFKEAEKTILLALECTWQAILDLELSTADAQIVRAETALFSLPIRVSDRYRDELATLRAACLIQKDDSLAALALITSETRGSYGRRQSDGASAIYRYGYWKLGDIERCHSAQWQLNALIKTKRSVVPTIFDLSTQSAIELEQLRFPSAKRLARDALALAERIEEPNCTIAALPASILAQILYDEGYLEEAEALIAKRLAAIRGSGTIETCIRAYTVLGRLAMYRHQLNLALLILHEAETLGAQRDWPRLISASVILQIEILTGCMQIDEAEKCVERLDRLASHPTSDGFVRAEIKRLAVLGRCRVTLARGQETEALLTLRHAYDVAAAQHAFYQGFHLGIYLVQALAKVGATAEALDLLFEALRVGAAVGLYQAFLDAGTEVKTLLLHLHERNRSGARSLPNGVQSFVASLVGRSLSDNSVRVTPKVEFRSNSRLSDQEARTLSYISAGYSNKRIAKALHISPETVKSHVKHIFVKLSVGTRAEAVSRGETLGLICPLSRI